MRLPLSLLLSAFTLTASAQLPMMPGPIQMQQSTTTASLRGIHSAGPGVAWASGTNGTVLRTEDAGFVWQSCAMPPGAEKLDFRGIWAWDEQTAVVMSSGPGDQSRLYKTTDGCVTWKLMLTNTDKDGFWDAIAFADNSDKHTGYLLGDPVNGSIVLMRTTDDGASWKRLDSSGLAVPDAKIGFFAASNSSIAITDDGELWIGTGSAQGVNGKWQGPFLLKGAFDCDSQTLHPAGDPCYLRFRFSQQPAAIATGTDASGVFSLDLKYDHGGVAMVMVVGGNYSKPNESTATAARMLTWKSKWTAATHPPHGYRSSVAYDPTFRAWLTAGPNGTDYSRDDGRTWLPLENGNWNAISLPYLVGPTGRIGKLVSLPDDRKRGVPGP